MNRGWVSTVSRLRLECPNLARGDTRILGRTVLYEDIRTDSLSLNDTLSPLAVRRDSYYPEEKSSSKNNKMCERDVKEENRNGSLFFNTLVVQDLSW